MNTNELLTSRLNETGFPFQEECYQKIKDTKDSLVKEYPFTYPPSVQQIFLGKPGAIDILSLRIPKKDLFGDSFWSLFTFECKKSKPGIKNWCFVKTNRGGCDSKPSFVAAHVKGIEDSKLLYDVKLHQYDRISFFEDSMVKIDETVMHGFECNSLLETLNRNQEEKIYNSIMQSVTGMTWIEQVKFPRIKELTLNEEKIIGLSQRSNPPSYPTIMFIPVVVTTSALYVASFSPSDVGEGEIDGSKIKWEKKNWVVFDFGLPDYLQRDELTNRAVFIVNSQYLTTFYNSMMPSF